MYSLCVNALVRFSIKMEALISLSFHQDPTATGGQDKDVMQVLFHKHVWTIYGIHAYIILMNWSQFCITLGYNCCMLNAIRHNYPSLIHCLRAFHILCFAYLLFRCYCYNHYKTQKYYFCYRYHYYHITLLLNTLLQILSFQVLLN